MSELECGYCERRCVIPPGKTGFCGMYTNATDEPAAAGGPLPGTGAAAGPPPGRGIVERFPDTYSGIGLSHIEGVPFYHVMPGSRSLTLGGAGCTIDCAYCSNAYVARTDPEKVLSIRLEPEEILRIAGQTGCASVTFPINEPTVAVPTLLRLSKTLRAGGISFGILTNGFMTKETAVLLAGAADFANISLKAFSDEMYRKIAGFAGLSAVVRNIGIFHDRTHIELSTPVIQGVNDSEIGAMADFIASLDPSIPWHVFRLLPEYRMSASARPDIEDVVRILSRERKRLPYIYFGNFVGSRWVGTDCPSCGTTVVERINFGGCGAKLVSSRLREDRCPGCGTPLPFLCSGETGQGGAGRTERRIVRIGAVSADGGDGTDGSTGGTPRDIGCIDVIDWQTTFNLADGKPLEISAPMMDRVRDILKAHPYPGDLTGGGAAWVTDTALTVNDLYRPRLMILNYGDLFFARSFLPPEDARDAVLRDRMFAEISRFLRATDFEPVIIGLGDLRRPEGTIPLFGLDGWAEAVGMAPHYAGLYEPSKRDMERIAAAPGVERVVTKEEFRSLFGGCDGFYSRFPDALACAERGKTFRGLSSTSRPIFAIPARDMVLPLHGDLAVTHVGELAAAILERLATRPVALILAEGTGVSDFPLPHTEIDCSLHWHSYSYGEGHYQIITTGSHFTEQPYPPGYRSYLDDTGDKPYPFTAHFERIEPMSVGRRFPGKSAAVGARSILTHASAGTDIVIECFSRALYNHGVMAAVTAGKAL